MVGQLPIKIRLTLWTDTNSLCKDRVQSRSVTRAQYGVFVPRYVIHESSPNEDTQYVLRTNYEYGIRNIYESEQS